MPANALTFSLFGKDVSASKTIKGVADTADRAGSVFKGMATVAGGALAALGVSAGLASVKQYLGESVQAYKEASQAQLQLTDAYEKFPGVSSVSIDSLRQLNTELMNKTRFDDDALASGQAVLAQFNLTGDQVRDLTPLLADYAAKTGVDVPTAADQLGKAMLGQGRALKGVGIDFKDAGSVGANFEQVMSGLRTQVGGFAEKDGAEAEGMAERLKNQMGELQETVGAGLLPVIMQLQSAFLTYVVPVLSQVASTVSGAIGPAFASLIAFITPIAQQLGALFGPIISALGPQVVALAAAFSPLGLILQALQPVLPILAGLLQQVAGILSGVLAQALPIVTSLVAQMSTILSGVFAAILPLIGGLLTNIGTVMQQLMPVILQLVSALGSALMPVFTALMPIVTVLIGFIASLFAALMPLIDPILQIVLAFLPLLGIIGELIASLLPPLLQLFMAVLGPVMALITPLVELLAPVLGWVAQLIATLIGWLGQFVAFLIANVIPIIVNVAGGIRTAFTGIADFVGGVFKQVGRFIVGGINTVIDLVNGAIGLVNELGKTASSVTGGAIKWHIDKLPKIPALAEGGIVSAATLAMIGEGSEPEVVAPLSKLPQIAAAAGIGGGGPGMLHATIVLESGAVLGIARVALSEADSQNQATVSRGRRR